MGGFSAETAWAFSRRLIAEGQASLGDLLTLTRYGLFIKNNAVFVALLELLDGAEAQENCTGGSQKDMAKACGTMSLPALELHPLAFHTGETALHAAGNRAAGEGPGRRGACCALLANSVRDLPDEHYIKDREMYQASQDVDEYLALRKHEFVPQIETCQREGLLKKEVFFCKDS